VDPLKPSQVFGSEEGEIASPEVPDGGHSRGVVGRIQELCYHGDETVNGRLGTPQNPHQVTTHNNLESHSVPSSFPDTPNIHLHTGVRFSARPQKPSPACPPHSSIYLPHNALRSPCHRASLIRKGQPFIIPSERPGANAPRNCKTHWEDSIDIADLRTLFPVCNESVFLNNAAESPLNRRVQRRLEEYLILAAHEPQKKPPARDPVRAALSGLFGGQPQDYALVTSTGVGIGMAAAGFDWRAGDNVVVPMDEHWNNTFPWLALRDRGVDCRLVPVGEDQRVALDSVAARVDDSTRMLATTAVRFDTGFRADLGALSSMAHDRDALFVVDGIQAAGACPLHVEKDGIDVLSCAGFKWLLGLPGTGFMYVGERARERINPVLPGMYAAEHDMRELRFHQDSRRYETGTLAYSLFHSWTAGLEILGEVGVANIHERVIGLTDGLLAGARAKGITIVSPVETIEERSAILTFTLGSEEANRELYKKLMAQKIIVALREGRIRVSPNFFNTEEDIDRFLEEI
jgi:cysteine desulfurase/selenocysteine lyase